jgi:uncharacterized flavoprotein (TIGR03862 family)
MAADTLLAAGIAVDLYEAMPAPARKLLAAGSGGLNLTTEEKFSLFLGHYPGREERLRPFLKDFGPRQTQDWARSLDVATVRGAGGKVYPASRTAAELTHNWLTRLDNTGLRLHLGHRWLGWDEAGRLRFMTGQGETTAEAGAVVLALGGGSRPQLGATGQWRQILAAEGCAIAPFRPANCGFEVDFSEHFRARFAHLRLPLKNVVLIFSDGGQSFRKRGECLVTAYGLEGSLIYACGHLLRDSLEAGHEALVRFDLFPDTPQQALAEKLKRPRGRRSLASHLEKCLSLTGVRRGLAYEFIPKETFADSEALAAALKNLPIPLLRPRPLAEAISTAGGLCFSELDDHLMLKRRPGVFCAGEMLDWEAPTGGYLITCCLATGHAAGLAARNWLKKGSPSQTAWKRLHE